MLDLEEHLFAVMSDGNKDSEHDAGIMVAKATITDD